MGKSSEINEFASIIYARNKFTDIEKGAIDNEHIVLSVTGMTCTGCETKLQRVLATLPHISDLKTSLLMGRAEFNLNTASMSPGTVIKHLERITEFKCERLSTQGSNIDVVPDNLTDFLKRPLPLGVDDMLPLGKDAVRINFDPKIIGARSLVKKSGPYPCQLAPPLTDPGLAAGSKARPKYELHDHFIRGFDYPCFGSRLGSSQRSPDSIWGCAVGSRNCHSGRRCWTVLPHGLEESHFLPHDRDGPAHCPQHKRRVHLLRRIIWLPGEWETACHWGVL